jgi:hypothetical protein
MENRLASVFDFSKEELEANRNGYLSKRQLSLLRKEIHDTMLAYRLVMFVVLLGSIGYIYWCIRNGVSIWAGILGFIVLESGALLHYRPYHLQAKDLTKAANVQVIEGRVDFEKRFVYKGRQQLLHHYIRVGKEEFFVSQSQYALFPSYEPYRIYFTSGKIWSCEPALQEE